MAYTPMQLAEAFIKTGELADALDALNQQLETDPDHEMARRLRAQVIARMPGEANLRAALADLDRIATPTPADSLWRVVTLEQLGDTVAATQAAADAHAAHPDDRALAERLFYLYLRGKDFAAGRRLLNAMPRTWNWLHKAGDLATEDGHTEDAPGYYTAALADLEQQFPPTDDFGQGIRAMILAARARVYATLGQMAQADSDYAAAMTLIPDDPMLPFWRGFVAADRGYTELAGELCRAAFALANETFKKQMRDTLATFHAQGRYTALTAS
ncbi:MAG: tetratricopeptide repeat protein [Anaerolineaceae bacterium]|nr:tetratricopeptide repeat protein [Anaerolineaceae bacterium]